MRGTIAVDFDGVLHDYGKVSWRAEHVICGPPIPGAIEWLNGLSMCFNIVILTCRGRTWRGRRAVKRWLWERGFSPHCKRWQDVGLVVTDRKPLASLYVDDRAYLFDGSFPDRSAITIYNP